MRSVRKTEYHTAHLDALPRLSELTGRKMVSFGGRLLGAVEDALIDERDGRIIGYPLERSGPGTWLESVLGLGGWKEQPDYVRADGGHECPLTGRAIDIEMHLDRTRKRVQVLRPSGRDAALINLLERAREAGARGGRGCRCEDQGARTRTDERT